jgi:hypothetical protein
MTTDMTPILTVRNLCTGYGKKQVLFNVSLDVMPGEILLITGGNGSGKPNREKRDAALQVTRMAEPRPTSECNPPDAEGQGGNPPCSKPSTACSRRGPPTPESCSVPTPTARPSNIIGEKQTCFEAHDEQSDIW